MDTASSKFRTDLDAAAETALGIMQKANAEAPERVDPFSVEDDLPSNVPPPHDDITEPAVPEDKPEDAPADEAPPADPSTDDEIARLEKEHREALEARQRQIEEDLRRQREDERFEKLLRATQKREAAEPSPSRAPRPVDIDVDDMTETERYLYEQNKQLAERVKRYDDHLATTQKAREQMEREQAIYQLKEHAKKAQSKYTDVFDDTYMGKLAAREVERQVLYESDEPVALIAARVAKQFREERKTRQRNYVQKKIGQQKTRTASGSGRTSAPKQKDSALTYNEWKKDGGRLAMRAALRRIREG